MSNLNDSTPSIPVYKKSCFMHKTILKNDLETLKHMLSDGRRDSINDLDYSGRTPFHVALQSANPKALYLMLYYPLLHPSKLFAVHNWKSVLDSNPSNLPSSPSNAAANLDLLRKNGPPSTEAPNANAASESHEGYPERAKSCDSLDSSSSTVGELLLSYWEKNPAEYFNTCLSLDDRSYIVGCGLKEVEALYEEHYKFLIGESHSLELAAKNYTNRYMRLYHASFLKNHAGEHSLMRTDSPNSASSTDLAADKSSDTTFEKPDQGSQDFNSVATTVEPSSVQSQCFQAAKERLVERVAERVASDTADKIAKGMLPLETVDLIATFDKTSPLHLLFSNVYITSYRSNMLKCFRILIYYFNKSNEFHNMFNSLDYTLYFNSHSINRCLELYWNSRNLHKLNKEKYMEKQEAEAKAAAEAREDERKEQEMAEDAPEDPDCPSKRDLEPEDVNPKRPKTDSPDATDSKLANFPNLTVCADATEMAQKKDKRSYSLLNSYPSPTVADTDYLYSLYEEWDTRSFSLHYLMTNTAFCVRPHVSWETFVKNPDFSRSTILHRVCNLKDQNLIKLVLSCGFSPIVVNESGDMPVHLSVDAKDPYGFLTILHATLKAFFYSRFNPRNHDIELFFSETTDKMLASPDAFERFFDRMGAMSDNSNDKFLNEFYNMYMGYACSSFFRCTEDLNEGFYSLIERPKFRALATTMTPETRKLLFDEFLMLFEQLVYRAIKSSAWECLIALLSYNAVITYHLLSNPCFMHRFINFATMNNNSDEFMNILEFVMTNVLFEKTAAAPEPEASHAEAQHVPSTDVAKVPRKDSFKGCGIPHSGLRSFSLTQGYKSVGSYVSPCFNEDVTLSTFIKNYKRSTRCQEKHLKTWIVTHPTCLHHLATPEPTDAPNKRHRLIVTYPENPTRLEVIISNDNGILRSDTLENVKLIHSPPPASLADILRVHDWAYIDKLLEQVQVAQRRWVTHPYWPVLADGDTPVTPHSWSAALYAAGSVLSAVDAVCTNLCKNAFCAVRPPGHHLGTWGAAQSSNFEDEDFAAGSQGFCLINNVAIGAAYAKYTYGQKGIRRIAIIDFDVHHGNGTEQVVRNIGPKKVRIRPSAAENMYPGSQLQPETMYKKWFGWRDENDRDEVLFCSIHAYDGVFYPGTGQQCTLYQEDNNPNVINVAVPQGTSSAEFRALFETKICPYVYHFRPDLIFISAGFDGHYRDSVSYGFTRYTEKDFNYVTERLVTIANSVCEGRVVSVLEGGYNTKLNTLSPFARSVLEHVTALCNTNRNTTYPYMYGEHSISYLFAPVVNTVTKTPGELENTDTHNKEILSTLNYTLNSLTNGAKGNGGAAEPPERPHISYRKANSDAVFKAYKLRMKTELLISKVYSQHFNYCRQPRLVKFDKTQMCCRSIFELYGNFYLAFYSRYFYSLFAVSTSLLTSPHVFAKNLKPPSEAPDHVNSPVSSTPPEIAQEPDLVAPEDALPALNAGAAVLEAEVAPPQGDNSEVPTTPPHPTMQVTVELTDGFVNYHAPNGPNTDKMMDRAALNGADQLNLSLLEVSAGHAKDAADRSHQPATNGAVDPANRKGPSEITDPYTAISEAVKQAQKTDYEEDIDDVVMRLKAINDVNRSNVLISMNPWLANVKIKALEQNYQVAVRLDAFYSKFAHLFDHSCHIHR